MVTLDAILRSPEIVRTLSQTFLVDFDQQQVDREVWFELRPRMAFEVMAGEDAGGLFIRQKSAPAGTHPIMFVSSEGQSGRIAQHMTEFIQLVVAMPYWLDVLKFSNGGRIEEMSKAARRLEEEILEYEPKLTLKRQQVLQALGVKPVENPVERLHVAVTSTEHVAVDDAGEYESLFGDFNVSDNPEW